MTALAVTGCGTSATQEARAAAADKSERGPKEEADVVSQDWPLYRGNPQSTGVAASSLPERLDVLWRYRVEKGAFEGTPAIVDDTVYVADLDGRKP